MRRFTLLLVLLSFLGGIANAQTKKVTGTVTSAEDGLGLPGVSVIVEGTTIGTSTDLDGNYTLMIPVNTAKLIFRFVGFETQEITAITDVINVVLKTASEELEEVVVTGYAPRSRESITGSVQIVEAKKIESVPVPSFDQILQGMSPGVTVISNSGRPGAAATVTIRGVGSINAGTDPLYIIDGVPVGAADFSTLNPNDIESVAVLKDAASVAIYGSRGANGVIQVATKKGKPSEKSTITYRGQYGQASNIKDKAMMMNAEQKIDYEVDITEKGYQNIRAQGTMTDNEFETYLDSLKSVNTNWRDVFFRQAQVQSHEVSTRGGSEKTTYFISGGYYQQEGTLIRSEFERWTSRINLEHKVNDYISVGTNASLGYETNSLTVSSRANIWDPVFASLLLNPYEQPYDSEGNYIEEFETYSWGNPLQQLDLNTSDNNQYKIVGNLYSEIEPIKDLIFKTSAGMDFYDYISNSYYHPDSYWGNTGGNTNGGAYKYFSRGQSITYTNTLRYKISMPEEHTLNVLLGSEIIKSRSESLSAEGANFGHDALYALNNTTTPLSVGGTYWGHAYLSYFSTLNYGFQKKYYLDLSYRRDGSSRFGPDVKYAPFWSVGTSWNVMGEDFLIGNNIISNLKLRLSYGTTGNSQIGDYPWEGTYGYGISYGGHPTSGPLVPVNPNLTWEKSSILNFGIDYGFLNKIRGNIDLYRKYTYDMLFDVPVSYTSGFESGIQNICSMINQGIEFSIDADVLTISDFNWNLNANFAYNSNKVTELYHGVDEFIESENIIIKVGYPVRSFNLTKFAGVNPANGTSLWYDKNGNLVDYYSDANRQLTNWSMYPPFTGGLTSTFTYKGINLSAFLAFVKGKYMINNTFYFLNSNGIFSAYNQTTKMLEYWKEPGDITEVPIPIGVNEFDTRLLEDASFLRLRNLVLSYQIPSKYLTKLKVSSLRVYAQAQNLLTFTKYQGYDPEYPDVYEVNNYPMYKTISFGVDLGL